MVNDTQPCVTWVVHDYVFRDLDQGSGDVQDTVVRTLSPIGVLVASMLLSTAGYFAMRLVSVVCAFGAGALLVIRLTHMNGDDSSFSCDGVSVAVVASGAAAALVAFFLLRTLSFLLGGAAVCGVVAVVFSACDEACAGDLWAGAPRLFGLSLVPYWTTMLVGGAVGACAARRRYREVLAVAAAVVGGYGSAVAVRILLLEHASVAVPSWGFLTTIAGVSIGGLLAQYAIVQCRRRRRTIEPKAAAV